MKSLARFGCHTILSRLPTIFFTNDSAWPSTKTALAFVFPECLSRNKPLRPQTVSSRSSGWRTLFPFLSRSGTADHFP